MRFRSAAVLLLAIGVAACSPAPVPSSSASARATASPGVSTTASPTPGSTPSPAEQASTTWVGDPITVAEAIDHRDHDLDDTELAVAGWAWTPAGSVFCPLVVPSSPAMEHCPDNLTWISDRDPGPQTGPKFVSPAQPAMTLLIRPDTYAQLPLPPQPGKVIVMGHFDDHRANDCPAGQVDDCRRNFIVDAILDPDAPALDRSLIDGRQIEPGTTSRGTPASVVEGATGVPPGADRILVASPVPGAALASYEPKAAGVDALTSAQDVWLIRYLARTNNRPVVKTVLVADRTDLSAGNVFVVLPSGEVAIQ
jgi:hypothetical protein